MSAHEGRPQGGSPVAAGIRRWGLGVLVVLVVAAGVAWFVDWTPKSVGDCVRVFEERLGGGATKITVRSIGCGQNGAYIIRGTFTAAQPCPPGTEKQQLGLCLARPTAEEAG